MSSMLPSGASPSRKGPEIKPNLSVPNPAARRAPTSHHPEVIPPTAVPHLSETPAQMRKEVPEIILPQAAAAGEPIKDTTPAAQTPQEVAIFSADTPSHTTTRDVPPPCAAAAPSADSTPTDAIHPEPQPETQIEQGTTETTTNQPTVVVRREASSTPASASTETTNSEAPTGKQQEIVVTVKGEEMRLSEENAQELLAGLISSGVKLPDLSPEDTRTLIDSLVESLGSQAAHTINQEVTTLIEAKRREQNAPGLVLRDIRESLNRDRGPLGDSDEILRQSDVAKALEWSLSKVVRIERGEVNPSAVDIKSLASYYGVTDTELINFLVANKKNNKWSLSTDKEQHP